MDNWNEGLPSRLNEENWYLPFGTLVIGGGGECPEFDEAIIKYAGGKDAPMVVVPTADSIATKGPYPPIPGGYKEQGFSNIQVLHTRDRQEADSAEFVKPLAAAKCVLFEGGETYRLFETYVGTRFHQEVQGVLDRGGVVAGYSAGAMVMGAMVIDRPYMRFRGYEPGFGFLPNSIIDVHVIARNMHLDLIAAREQYPNCSGFGIDERAAIVVQEDWIYPIGQSYTLVYDYEVNKQNDGHFYFLKSGDVYNLKRKVAERKSWTMKPFERFYR